MPLPRNSVLNVSLSVLHLTECAVWTTAYIINVTAVSVTVVAYFIIVNYYC